MNFYIHTLGCKVNAYESEIMKELLLKDGFIYDEENPQIVIINTCTVTNMADNKSKKMVRHFRKLFPKSILVVCGCSSQNKEADYQNLDIDILLGNQKKSEIVSIIKDYLKNHEKVLYINQNRNLPFEDMQIKKFETHTRAFVKIEDGCDNFCSYCVIPFVRGSVRSKDFETTLKEIHELVLNGHQEVVLTGIHTGAYYNSNHDLTDLIHEISKEPNLKKIRISSIEITELNDKFINELKNNDKICNHLHIPLQAGSNEILKLMNRKYDLDEFKRIINKIRKVRKDIAITTDIIVGHPYETEELFRETIKTAREINFAKIHVFPYSKREKTKAAMMNNQVSEEEKKNRSKRLIEVSNELEKNYYQKFINQTLDVLVLQSKEESIGITDNYLKVKIADKLEANQIVKVIVSDFNNGFLIGKVACKNACLEL